MAKWQQNPGINSPDPLVCLLGHVNETRVVVEGVEKMALVNTGSQISALTEGFCTEIGLRILPLRNLMRGVLHIEGMGAFQYHTKDVRRLNSLSDIPWCNEDVLFLVVANHKYGYRVPVQIATQVIDQLVVTMTKKELQKVGETLKQVHLAPHGLIKKYCKRP